MDRLNVSNARCCDGEICRICEFQLTPQDISYRISVPTKKLIRLKQDTINKLQIKWNKNQSSNYFHQKCWDDLQEECSSTPNPRGRIGTTEFNLMRAVDETIEKFDTFELLRKDAKQIADLLKQSRHTVAFTGAGLSASAGIPTYRGADGIDTIDAHCGSEPLTKKQKRGEEKEDEEEEEEEEEVPYESLLPTYAHHALTALNSHGLLHYCITQNCDNLHLKSLFPRSSLTELHGNVFCEYCEKCLKEYFRSYSVDQWSTDCHQETWYRRCSQCGFGHYTSRRCDKKKCNGLLKDTIVNFGDDLHETVLGGYPAAERECDRGDLCLALGTSLTVSPANDLPLRCRDLVIVNLQKTDFDDRAKVRCWATCDLMMRLIMEELSLTIAGGGGAGVVIEVL
jgi:NAD+-dependent protein deacetylase sirtuin 6